MQIPLKPLLTDLRSLHGSRCDGFTPSRACRRLMLLHGRCSASRHWWLPHSHIRSAPPLITGGFNSSERADLKLKSVAGDKTQRRIMSGNMRVGDLNQFQLYHEGPLQMNSMVNSGKVAPGSALSCDIGANEWLNRQLVLCVIYALINAMFLWLSRR